MTSQSARSRERTNVIHDLDGSDDGEWEGPSIPMDEFDGIKRPKADRLEGYDLWVDLSSLKANITFSQLLEISPMAMKTLEEGMPALQEIVYNLDMEYDIY